MFRCVWLVVIVISVSSCGVIDMVMMTSGNNSEHSPQSFRLRRISSFFVTWLIARHNSLSYDIILNKTGLSFFFSFFWTAWIAICLKSVSEPCEIFFVTVSCPLFYFIFFVTVSCPLFFFFSNLPLTFLNFFLWNDSIVLNVCVRDNMSCLRCERLLWIVKRTVLIWKCE